MSLVLSPLAFLWVSQASPQALAANLGNSHLNSFAKRISSTNLVSNCLDIHSFRYLGR